MDWTIEQGIANCYGFDSMEAMFSRLMARLIATVLTARRLCFLGQLLRF